MRSPAGAQGEQVVGKGAGEPGGASLLEVPPQVGFDVDDDQVVR